MTKARFWRAFGVALLCHVITMFVLSVTYGGATVALQVVIGALILFGLSAWKFPRGASVVLVAFSVGAVVSEIEIGMHNPWRYLLLTVDLIAVLFAARAFRLAAAHLAFERSSE